MKTFTYLLVAAVAVPALAGPGFAQTSKPAAPPAAPAAAPAVTPAVTQDAAKVAGKSLAGELVSVDQTAKTVTVKHMVDSKPMQLTMNVEDTAIATSRWAGSASSRASSRASREVRRTQHPRARVRST